MRQQPILPESRGFYMYVLKCADDSLYTGYTVSLPHRLGAHQRGRASKYTRARLPVELLGWWTFPSQRTAMQAEWAFKGLSRHAKLACLSSGSLPGMQGSGDPPDGLWAQQARVANDS